MKQMSVFFTVLSLFLYSTVARADGGLYKGQGYTVIVGDNGSYRGCDSRNRCLSIAQPSSHEGESYTWENSGFVYSLQPVAGSSVSEGYASTKFVLTVLNPQGKRILRKILQAQGVGG
jgi:hypothetical protein